MRSLTERIGASMSYRRPSSSNKKKKKAST
jgi:hypothetical protein